MKDGSLFLKPEEFGVRAVECSVEEGAKLSVRGHELSLESPHRIAPVITRSEALAVAGPCLGSLSFLLPTGRI